MVTAQWRKPATLCPASSARSGATPWAAAVSGAGDDTVVEVANAAGIEVVHATGQAPLLGRPMASGSGQPQG
jgi:hypothetical protein